MSYNNAKELYASIGVDVEKALEILKANGEDAYILGSIVKSEAKITIK